MQYVVFCVWLLSLGNRGLEVACTSISFFFYFQIVLHHIAISHFIFLAVYVFTNYVFSSLCVYYVH